MKNKVKAALATRNKGVVVRAERPLGQRVAITLLSSGISVATAYAMGRAGESAKAKVQLQHMRRVESYVSHMTDMAERLSRVSAESREQAGAESTAV
jgi:hypothetical protein